jgi:hypothetical protein
LEMWLVTDTKDPSTGTSDVDVCSLGEKRGETVGNWAIGGEDKVFTEL